MNWRDFWNSENAIYVNDRHRALHDDSIARDVAALVEAPDQIVLDFGCGEASSAALTAAACGRLYLYDAAPVVREHLRLRFTRNEKIVVLGEPGLDAVDDGALDLVVVNSVLQYLSRAEYDALLDRALVKLKPAGRLVIADVIPVNARAVDDVLALLKFAREGGFFFAALAGLVRTVFSDYSKLRAQLGLARYSEAEMRAILKARGFDAARAPANVGHNQARMMFVARPAAAPL